MWLQCMTQVTMSRQGGKRTCGRSFFETDGVNVVKAWRIFTPLRRSWGKCEVFHCLSLKEYSLWNFPLFAPREGFFLCSSVFLDVKQVHQFTSKATRGDKCLDKLGVTGDNLSHECQMRYMTFSILCNVWLFGCLVVLQVSAVSSFWPLAFTCSSLERFLWFSVFPRHSVWSDLPAAEMQAVQVFVFLCQRKTRRYFFGQYRLWLIWLI